VTEKNTLPVTATSATTTLAGRSNNQTNRVGTGSPKEPEPKDAQDGKIKYGCDTRARWNKSHETNFYCPFGTLPKLESNTMPTIIPRKTFSPAAYGAAEPFTDCGQNQHSFRSSDPETNQTS
jgi:hypothetical protein